MTRNVIDVAVVGAWDARPEDVRAVCLSVAECFGPAIAQKPLEPIVVEPSPLGHPRMLFARLDSGQVRIWLSARGKAWAKFAYQFGHEFTHVLVGVEGERGATFLEESLCELGSLFALQSLAVKWQTAPPYDNWREYAPAFGEYLQDCLDDAARTLPAGAHFMEWAEREVLALDSPTTDRAREVATVVAARLLPLASDSELWRAVRYVDGVPFGRECFVRWRAQAPPDLHGAIGRVECALVADVPATDGQGGR